VGGGGGLGVGVGVLGVGGLEVLGSKDWACCIWHITLSFVHFFHLLI